VESVAFLRSTPEFRPHWGLGAGVGLKPGQAQVELELGQQGRGGQRGRGAAGQRGQEPLGLGLLRLEGGRQWGLEPRRGLEPLPEALPMVED
jgi:hypothetical protein